ncbi:amidohydrolase [Mycolicibacterium fluoranthenivorans]|uniref:Amidohydrolase n=1 Tax=Mycolicibacterium fluoranthenivorans TaxID=258505 RepID=A0A7G8PM26_9MYCO|nr:amidohydrolase [Mycolicibacterium fluoranthenivorans]
MSSALIVNWLACAFDHERTGTQIPGRKGSHVKDIQVAAVQFEPTLFDKPGNIDRVAELVTRAAAGGAELITAPEMCTTGYCFFDQREAERMAEPVPGPTTDRFAQIAREHHCYIVFGMPERDEQTGLLYNTAAFVGPDGFIGKHRKTHAYIAEPKWAAPGNLGHQVFDTEIGRIAVLICMDIHFVETARLAAVGGAEVICHLSNWLAERTPAPYWISRAYENGCYVIESNRWGLERGVQFSGGSCVIAPDATILDQIDSGDGLATATITVDAAHQDWADRPALRARRPELYRQLQINSYLWNPKDFFGLYGHRGLPEGKSATVAVAQFRPAPDLDANLATISRMFRSSVTERGAELVVFPELSLTTRAVTLQDPAVGQLMQAAAAESAWLVVGLAESDPVEGRQYNSLVLIGPDGIEAVHRKIHLRHGERALFEAGSAWTYADIPLGRVGLLHGDDLLLPESGRILALNACDVIAGSADNRERIMMGHSGSTVAQSYPIPTGPSLTHWHHMRVRAGENNVYLAFANTVDADGEGGCSGVFGPDTFAFPRNEQVLAGQEGVAAVRIDTRDAASVYPSNVVRRKDLVTMRLPHWYGALSGPDALVHDAGAELDDWRVHEPSSAVIA